jgi:hypothetical protein
MRIAVQNILNRYIISGDQPTPAAKQAANRRCQKKRTQDENKPP